MGLIILIYEIMWRLNKTVHLEPLEQQLIHAQWILANVLNQIFYVLKKLKVHMGKCEYRQPID